MALKILRKGLEDAQAFQDKSSGKDTLREVLADMAKGSGIALKSFVDGAIVTAKLDAIIFPFDVKILDIVVFAEDWGDGNQTDISLDSASGALTEAVTIANDATDDEGIVFPINKVLPALDFAELIVEAAPTNGLNLTVVVTYAPVDVEA